MAEPHYEWDIWVPNYEAQSLAVLGGQQEAGAVLDRILPKKRAAWLLRFRARLDREAAMVQPHLDRGQHAPERARSAAGCGRCHVAARLG